MKNSFIGLKIMLHIHFWVVMPWSKVNILKNWCNCLDFLSLDEHLNSLTPPLCSVLESQIFSVHAVTGNDTTYPLSDLMRRLHLLFQRLHGSFPKLHNPRLSKQMFLAWQMTGVHVTEKEASKITSSTEIIKIVIYHSFHKILEE